MKNIDSINEYLKRNSSKGDNHTHTRIADKNNKIYGGTFNIIDRSTFLDLYFNHVFINNNKEYLTEKQKIEDAPLVIDIDMRYSEDVTERLHTKNHIIDLLNLYAENISKYCEISDNFTIEAFVMEKPNVNILDNKTKDGIHILLGVQCHKALQVMIRNSILSDLKIMWDDLPFTNDINDIVDEGITKGSVNWQMYGSRKPNHSAYLIKYHLMLKFNKTKSEWEFTEHDINNFDTKKNLPKLSVHYSDYPNIIVKESYKSDFDEMLINFSKKKKSKLSVKQYKSCDVDSIKTVDDIDNLINEMFENVENAAIDYELKETHQFTMLLPESYWGPGSDNLLDLFRNDS